MAAFAYNAINAQGLESSGVIHAPDSSAAAEQLQARGLLARSLHERSASGEGGARTSFKKVKPRSLQIFARQLATMMRAGVPLIQSFDIVARGSTNPKVTKLLTDIRNFGLMAAIDVRPREDGVGKRGYDILVDCYNSGALVRVTADTIALSPPVIAEHSHIDQIVQRLGESLQRVA